MWDDFVILRTFFVFFWFGLFIAALKIELLLKQLSLINISFASFFTGIFSTISKEIPGQIILFLILTIVFRIAIQPFYKKRKIKRIFENQIVPFIGREAVVTKQLSKSVVGEITFSGMHWEALSSENDTFEVGEKLLITNSVDSILVVSKLENQLNLVTNKSD